MAHSVFICYAPEDKLVADAACTALEARRIRCWIAPRDIDAGDEQIDAIVKSLDTCQIVLFILSAYAQDSELIQIVMEWATSQGKSIIRLHIDETQSSEPYRFAHGSAQWLAALTPPLDDSLEELCEHVSLMLNQHEVAEAPRWQEPVAESLTAAISEAVEAAPREVEERRAEPRQLEAIEPPVFGGARTRRPSAAQEKLYDEEYDEEEVRTPFWTIPKMVIAVLLCLVISVTGYYLFKVFKQSGEPVQQAQSGTEKQDDSPFFNLGGLLPMSSSSNTTPSNESATKPSTAPPMPSQKDAVSATVTAEKPTEKATSSNIDKGAKEGGGQSAAESLTWTDPATGLMWAKKDSGSEHDLAWKSAVAYCKNLQLDGHSDWRLPTVDELEQIYDPSVTVAGQRGAQSTRWHVKGNLELSGWQWSNTPADSADTVWYFSFGGVKRFPSEITNSYALRALCVRGGKH